MCDNLYSMKEFMNFHFVMQPCIITMKLASLNVVLFAKVVITTVKKIYLY